MESLLLASLLALGLPEAVLPPYHVALAEARLLAPAGTPEEASDFARESRALTAQAVRDEAMSPGEAQYWFSSPQFFQDQLDLLRERYLDLRDCPYAAEGFWVPPEPFCVSVRAFNDAFLLKLDEIELWNPDWGDRIATIRRETARLRAVWAALEWVRYEHCNVYVRRTKMREARNAMGREMWDRRELPPVAAMGAFRELR